ncbi:MAG: hypothetical protein ACTTIT_07005 [Treponema sp.]
MSDSTVLENGVYGYYDSYKQSKTNIAFPRLKQGNCRHSQTISSFKKRL